MSVYICRESRRETHTERQRETERDRDRELNAQATVISTHITTSLGAPKEPLRSSTTTVTLCGML